MTYYVQIKVSSERAAELLKAGIEESYPLVDGNVKIFKQPEIKPLNEVIKDLEGSKPSS